MYCIFSADFPSHNFCTASFCMYLSDLFSIRRCRLGWFSVSHSKTLSSVFFGFNMRPFSSFVCISTFSDNFQDADEQSVCLALKKITKNSLSGQWAIYSIIFLPVQLPVNRFFQSFISDDQCGCCSFRFFNICRNIW